MEIAPPITFDLIGYFAILLFFILEFSEKLVQFIGFLENHMPDQVFGYPKGVVTRASLYIVTSVSVLIFEIFLLFLLDEADIYLSLYVITSAFVFFFAGYWMFRKFSNKPITLRMERIEKILKIILIIIGVPVVGSHLYKESIHVYEAYYGIDQHNNK